MQIERGFTLIELLIAISIMSVGFLAMSQMQYLSFRQKTQAVKGVNATNVIQFAADRDLAEIKKRHLYNSYAYIEGLNAGSPIDPNVNFDYCGSGKLCDPCPCNPFEVLLSQPITATNNGFTETLCSPVDPENFDPESIDYVAVTACGAACPANTDCLYLVRRAELNYTDNAFNSDNFTVSLTYGVKDRRQILDTDNDDVVTIKETLATQNFQVSGHVAENYNEYVQNYDLVNVPHVP